MATSQLSTSISDLALTISSFYASAKVYTTCQTYGPCIGFFSMGIAALLGTIRFATNNLISQHKTASNISKGISLSLIASGFYEYYGTKGVFAFYTLVICSLFNIDVIHKVASITSILSILATVYHAGNHTNDESVYNHHIQGSLLACVGCMAYILFGIVIGTNGNIGTFKNVDIFHYGIAAANLMLAQSLEWWCYQGVVH
eukprot:319427_1